MEVMSYVYVFAPNYVAALRGALAAPWRSGYGDTSSLSFYWAEAGFYSQLAAISIYTVYINTGNGTNGKRQTELTENGNFRLFAANGKRKRQISVCFL
jgi:hypothetical protein